jgi:hypothetical protein
MHTHTHTHTHTHFSLCSYEGRIWVVEYIIESSTDYLTTPLSFLWWPRRSDVGGNLLNAELPRDMSIFPALEYLYLIGNLVPGALPQSLGNLQYMYVSLFSPSSHGLITIKDSMGQSCTRLLKRNINNVRTRMCMSVRVCVSIKGLEYAFGSPFRLYPSAPPPSVPTYLPPVLSAGRRAL